MPFSALSHEYVFSGGTEWKRTILTALQQSLWRDFWHHWGGFPFLGPLWLSRFRLHGSCLLSSLLPTLPKRIWVPGLFRGAVMSKILSCPEELHVYIEVCSVVQPQGEPGKKTQLWIPGEPPYAGRKTALQARFQRAVETTWIRVLKTKKPALSVFTSPTASS